MGMAAGLWGGQLKMGLLLAAVFPLFLVGVALLCRRELRRGARKNL